MDRRYGWRSLGARPFFFPCVFWMLGAWAGGAFAGPPTRILMLGAAFLLSAFLLDFRPGAHLCLLASCFLAAMGLARWEQKSLQPAFPPTSVQIEGEVLASTPSADTCRLLVAVARLDGPSFPIGRFKINLTSHSPGRCPLAGERIQLRSTLKSFVPASNPGESDRSSFLERQGLVFHGSFSPEAVVVLAPAPRWRIWADGNRRHLAEKVYGLAPTHDAGALFLALAAGSRSELSPELEDEFAASGLAHVLSISGLHVAALALAVVYALRRVLVRLGISGGLEASRLAAPLSLPLLWAYVLFTGAEPPAVRSAVMGSVFLLGLSFQRRGDALNSLSLAAMALLAYEPAAIADLSFQLSMLAVFALVLLTPAVEALLPRAKEESPPADGTLRSGLQRAVRSAKTTFAASLAVTFASLPLIAGTFHRFSLAGVLSNVACLPLCGLLTLVSASGAAVFVASPWLATPLVYVGSWLTWTLIQASSFFAHLPFSTASVASFGALAFGLYALGLLAFALGGRRMRWAGGGMALTALASAWLFPYVHRPALRMTFLAVGQGDATVVSTQHHHVLIDGGGVPGGGDPGRRVVVPFLRESGIRRLDLAVLTHPHPDHALGLISTLKAIHTSRLWLPAKVFGGELVRDVKEAAAGATVEEVSSAHAPIELDGAVLEVLGPPAQAPLKGVNDQSIVLRVRYGEVSALLTGDIERAGESALAAPASTVLKAPHHGSRTSSTVDFIRKVQPRFVVFCVGPHNRFGFPHSEVVERYEAAGTRCLRTDLHGAVQFETDGHDVWLKTFHPSPAPEKAWARKGSVDLRAVRPQPKADDP